MHDPLDALLKLLPLESLPRTGWLQHGIAPAESLAGHSLSVGFVALALAPRVEPALDVDRVAVLALVHDAPEALTGDLSLAGSALLPSGAKRAAEGAAARELLGPLALARWEEYEAGATREARFAKLCDRLQLGLRLLAYRRSGRRGLGDFEATLRETDCSEFEAAAEFQAELQAAIAALED
jgi:putative hydrolase of HD superfamily